MAGEWIKMRVDLPTHPKVVRMASACKSDRLRIVGGLLSAWGLFDAHSVDGQLEGYTPDVLDEAIGFPGFSQAMMAVGWLAFDGASLSMPRFEEHNGQSAKRRGQDAARKRNVRFLSDTKSENDPDSFREMSASEADEMRTREEKRRKEKEHSSAAADLPPGFVEFWAAWPTTPRKVGKAPCLKRWRSAALEPAADLIVAHVQAMKRTRQWQEGYEPAPMTYLNQRRWEDGTPADGYGGAAVDQYGVPL